MIDWRQVQPSADAPPDWDRRRDGCLRDQQPCAPSRRHPRHPPAIRDRRAADRRARRGRRYVASVQRRAGLGGRPCAGVGGPVDIRLDDCKRCCARSSGSRRSEARGSARGAPGPSRDHPAFLAPQRTRLLAGPARRSAPARSRPRRRRPRRALPASARLALGERHRATTARATTRSRRPSSAATLPPDVACAATSGAARRHRPRARARWPPTARRAATPPLRDVERALDARPVPRAAEPHLDHRAPAPPASTPVDGIDRALRAWEADPARRRRASSTRPARPPSASVCADTGLTRELQRQRRSGWPGAAQRDRPARRRRCPAPPARVRSAATRVGRRV